MANAQHWSVGVIKTAPVDVQTTPVGPAPSTDVAMNSAGVPTQYTVYLTCLPATTILDRSLTSITTPFPGVVSQMVMGMAGNATCSIGVLFGTGMATRGLIDPTLQNGYPLPNSTGMNVNATQLTTWVFK